MEKKTHCTAPATEGQKEGDNVFAYVCICISLRKYFMTHWVDINETLKVFLKTYLQLILLLKSTLFKISATANWL